MDLIEDFVKELNEAVKTQCVEAFVGGNYDDALTFLPCVLDPRKLGHSSSLLHLAAARDGMT